MTKTTWLSEEDKEAIRSAVESVLLYCFQNVDDDGCSMRGGDARIMSSYVIDELTGEEWPIGGQDYMRAREAKIRAT